MSWAQRMHGLCPRSCSKHCHFPTERLDGRTAGCALGTGGGFRDGRCVHHSSDPIAVRQREIRSARRAVVDPSPKVAVPAPAMEGCEAWFNDMLRAGIVPDGFRPDEGWPDSPHFRRLRRRYEQVCAAYVVGDFPLGAEHDAAVWLLGRVARLERLNAHTEFILRSPGDRKRPTADLAIFADETSPVWLIEWKTDLSGHSQLRRAIDQVRGYGKRTGRPCRLTVAGYDAEDRSVEEVEIRTPETLLSDLRAAARTATEDLVA